MLWPQMRMMRPYSRMTMVWKPIQRTTLRLTAGAAAPATALIGAHRPAGGPRAQQTAHAVTLDDAAAADDGDVAAQGLGFLEVVGGENDGGAAGVDLPEELPHRTADLDIHSRGGLVEDQEARLVHERARDHQAALHASGECTRDAAALVPQLQLLQVLLRALPRDRARDAVEARLVDHDGVRALEHVEVEFLRHDADAGLGGLGLAVDVVAEDARFPAGLVDQRGDDADEGRLPGPVGTEQREEVAALDLEVDAAQRLHAVAVGLGQSPYRKCIHPARIGARVRERKGRARTAAPALVQPVLWSRPPASGRPAACAGR